MPTRDLYPSEIAYQLSKHWCERNDIAEWQVHLRHLLGATGEDKWKECLACQCVVVRLRLLE